MKIWPVNIYLGHPSPIGLSCCLFSSRCSLVVILLFIPVSLWVLGLCLVLVLKCSSKFTFSFAIDEEEGPGHFSVIVFLLACGFQCCVYICLVSCFSLLSMIVLFPGRTVFLSFLILRKTWSPRTMSGFGNNMAQMLLGDTPSRLFKLFWLVEKHAHHGTGSLFLMYI